MHRLVQRLAAVLLLALPLAAIPAFTGPTAASADTFWTQSFADAQTLTQDQGPTVIASVSFTAAAGEAHVLRSQLVASANADYLAASPPKTDMAVSMGTAIECRVPFESAAVSRILSGTNIRPIDADVPIPNRLLFVVPDRFTTPTDFTCSLVAVTSSHNSTPAQVDLLGSSYIADVDGPLGTTDVSAKVAAASPAMRTPVYVSPGLAPAPLVIVDGYLPPADYTSIDAAADVYISECHRGREQSLASNHCAGHNDPFSSTTAVSQLVVTEYRLDGITPCAVHPGPIRRTTISSNLHHRKVTDGMTGLTHQPGCGNVWSAAVWLSAQPKKNGFVITWGGGPYTTAFLIARSNRE